MPRAFNDTSRFQEPLTPEDLYWLGWLATDGTVVHSKGATKTTLALHKDDRHVVEGFQKYLGTEKGLAEIEYAGRKDQVAMTFCSTSLCRRLEGFGITSKKSLTLKVREDLAKSPEFWIGALEGDGCISINTSDKGYGVYEYITIHLATASEAFRDQFVEFVNGLGFEARDHQYTPEGYSTGYSVYIKGSQADIHRFVTTLLSYSKVTPLLSRKWDIVTKRTPPVDRKKRNLDIWTTRQETDLTLKEIASMFDVSLTQTKAILREMRACH